MKQHYGIIELGTSENIGKKANEIDLITAQFVHYPDYQQLTIWLPQYGRQGYGNIRLINNKTKTVVDDRPVSDRLNGSIQILWDTLDIPPSDYTIEIEHPKGGKHILPFKKYAKGKEVKKEKYIPEPKFQDNAPSLSKTYKYDFGNMFSSQDLILKEKITKELPEQLIKHVTYEGSFRLGYVIYIEGDIRLRFMHDMCDGGCKFYIKIPTEKQWETNTKTPLSRRTDILAFIAHAVQSDHALNWQYEIREDCIYYY